MSIVNIKDVRTFLGISAADKSDDKLVEMIQAQAERWCKTFCRREFESAAYKERHDGNGEQNLFLQELPVTDITAASIGARDAMGVTNSATTGNATVAVTSTAVVLTVNEVATSILFADNATLADIETAITAESGWTATLTDSDFGSYLSTALLKTPAQYAMNGVTYNLEIADQSLTGYELYAKEGVLYRSAGWPRGVQNIRVDYTAGYTSTTLPSDLEGSILYVIKFLYQKRSEETLGVSQNSIAGMAAVFDGSIPSQAREIWNYYKKRKV
jgi:hypothetical protein